MERFNLKKLNEAKGNEWYHVEVSSRFAVLQDSNAEVSITSAWETIRVHIKFQEKRI
jgi:hypothetical protein